MPDEFEPDNYATVHLGHRALAVERSVQLRRPGRTSAQPECVLIGHAWIDDEARHGGRICIVCQAVRLP